MRRLFSENRRDAFAQNLIILFFFLFSCSLSAQNGAQQQYILFRGVVIDAVSRQPVEGVSYSPDRKSLTGVNGFFSFYAHHKDTVTFEREGYRKTFFLVSDTLKAKEYTMGIYMNPDTLYLNEIVIIPRLGDLRSSVIMNPPSQSAEQVNAINNLRISAYQGKVGINQLGNPDANYQFIKENQKITAFEKGGIPSDKMVGLSPFMIVPLMIHLIKGAPEKPAPPDPFVSSKEIEELNNLSKSMSKDKK